MALGHEKHVSFVRTYMLRQHCGQEDHFMC